MLMVLLRYFQRDSVRALAVCKTEWFWRNGHLDPSAFLVYRDGMNDAHACNLLMEELTPEIFRPRGDIETELPCLGVDLPHSIFQFYELFCEDLYPQELFASEIDSNELPATERL